MNIDEIREKFEACLPDGWCVTANKRLRKKLARFCSSQRIVVIAPTFSEADFESALDYMKINKMIEVEEVA